MNKGIRLIKRLAALLLVLLLSIESFAAVVSDNDGSAFITKAEFDSLKNNFQAQIDQYNTSIDNKIDGAIASYLAGINMSKEVKVNVWNSNRNYVIAKNFVPSVDYRFMKWSLHANLHNRGIPADNHATAVSVVYDDEYIPKYGTYYDTRLVVNAGTEREIVNDGDTVFWRGRAKDWRDDISLNFSAHHTKSNNNYYYIALNQNPTFRAEHLLYLNDIGYDADYSTNFNSYYKPQLAGTSDWSQNPAFTWKDMWSFDYSGFLIRANLNDVGNQTFDYRYIVDYNDIQYDNLYDVNWVHRISRIPDTNRTIKSWWSDSTYGNWSKSNKWYGYDLPNTSQSGTSTSISPHHSNVTAYAIDNTNDGSSVVAWTTGCIDKALRSSEITQERAGIDVIDDTLVFPEPSLNIRSGSIMLCGKANDIIKWTPVLCNCKYWTTGGSVALSPSDFCMVLSYYPFVDGAYVDVSGAIPSDIDKNYKLYCVSDEMKKDPSEPFEWALNDDNTKIINWEMYKDSIVYAKWYPIDSTIRSYNWEATLDLTGTGGTYTRQRE